MSAEQQQREELESILREIYKKYKSFDPYTLYYKINRNIKKCSSLMDNFYLISSIGLDPSVKWALYVLHMRNEAPFKDCTGGYYHYFLEQFIDDFRLFGSIAGDRLLIFVGDFPRYEEDPLSQILEYRVLLSGHAFRHFYICSYIYLIEPYDSDPASIFHGRKGVVAYCTSLYNLFLIKRQGKCIFCSRGIELSGAQAELGRILDEAVKKIKYSNICNIDLIEKMIHDEIEEANRLMREYGIIRVAFPLD